MPPKKRKRRKAPARRSRSRFPLFRALLWLSVVALAGLTLFTLLRMSQVPPRSGEKLPAAAGTTSRPSPPAKRPAAPQPPVPPGPSGQETPPQEYEVQPDDFEAKVRQVDLAILQSLTAVGQSQSMLRHKTVEARKYGGQEFFYQNLTIGEQRDIFPFLAELRRNLGRLAPDARLETVNENPRDLEISIFGEPTHHLFLPLTMPPGPPASHASAPRLVIVIDDLGESTAVARRLAGLPFPVTFSVLPYNTKAREVADMARQKNLELLLHLPCEPEGYPLKADSGPGTLRADMSPEELERTLAANLARLPEVDGVNNHMGSRLTQNRKAMHIILAHLKGRGKFFLDSVTTPKTCVASVSAALGMRQYRRHIFLDNTPKEHAILLQLKKAETLARKNGMAVVIGHPYPSTLAALESWARTRSSEIIVCRLQDI